MVEHPGFQAIQRSIAQQPDKRRGGQLGLRAAGAILAARTRGVSAAAKKRNPRLKRVKG